VGLLADWRAALSCQGVSRPARQRARPSSAARTPPRRSQ
jgi:hypothetical protein